MISCIFCPGDGQVYKYPKKLVRKKVKMYDIKITEKQKKKIKKKKVLGVCTACRHKYYFNKYG